MNKYLQSIESLESRGTSVQSGHVLPESMSILEIGEQAPITTCGEIQSPIEETSRENVSYVAPQKVIVRTYILRK